MDMSSIKIDKSLELETALNAQVPNWLIIVDEKTQLKFSRQVNSSPVYKSDMINPTCEKLTEYSTRIRKATIKGGIN